MDIYEPKKHMDEVTYKLQLRLFKKELNKVGRHEDAKGL